MSDGQSPKTAPAIATTFGLTVAGYATPRGKSARVGPVASRRRARPIGARSSRRLVARFRRLLAGDRGGRVAGQRLRRRRTVQLAVNELAVNQLAVIELAVNQLVAIELAVIELAVIQPGALERGAVQVGAG